MTKAGLGVGAAVALALAGGVLVPGVGQEVHPRTQVVSAEIGEENGGASLFGQFRLNAAAWLQMRADLYLHNGVEMRGLTDGEKRRGKTGVGGDEDNHTHSDQLVNDSAIVTVIPSSEEDFRGFFGDIERSTSAYRDMHNHTHNDPGEVLPLFRLATWIDPQFISGWCFGAMVMVRDKDPKSVDRAIDYLKEGLRQNPNAIEIVTQIGSQYASKKADIPNALKFLERARELARKQTLQNTTTSEAEAACEAYRWLALVYQHEKRHQDQVDAANEGLAKFKDDKVLRRLAK